MARHGSKALIDKIEKSIPLLREILRDPKLSAETQIADIDFACWALVELAFKLQQAVRNELGDIE